MEYEEFESSDSEDEETRRINAAKRTQFYILIDDDEEIPGTLYRYLDADLFQVYNRNEDGLYTANRYKIKFLGVPEEKMVMVDVVDESTEEETYLIRYVGVNH